MRYSQQDSNIHVPSTILFLIIIGILSLFLLVGCGKQEATSSEKQTEITDTPTIYTVINQGFYKNCIVQVIELRYNSLYRLRTTSCPQSFDENKEFEVSHNELKILIN